MTKVLEQQRDGGVVFKGPGVFSAYDATLTVAAEAGDNVDVTLQLIDSAKKAVKVSGVAVLFYVTADTAGDFATGTALTTLTTVSAAELIRALVTGQVLLAYTNSSGQIVVRGTIAGAETRRLVAVMPDGRGIQSGTMTWAA